VSQQNKKKLPVSTFFQFMADVFDISDQPLLANITTNFHKFAMAPIPM
jgi:hypothetical protein